MKHKRHSYQVYKHSPDPFPKVVMNRRMFIIIDQNGNLMTHKEGNLLIFYRGRDARRFIERNKLGERWKEKRVQLDITMV